MLQKFDDTFETEIHVPLQLSGVPNGVVITDSLPGELVFTVRDRGTNLFHYISNAEVHAPIVLDFAMYNTDSRSGHVRIPLDNIQHIFQQQLLTTSHIQRIRPDTLEFYYNRGVAHRLPVKFKGSIGTDPHCYLQYVTFNPESVDVYAPESITDTMLGVYITPMHIKSLKRTSTATVHFPHIRGVKYGQSTAEMTSHIDYYTERSVKVPIQGTNFPAGITLRTFPAEATVTYRIGAANAQYVKSDQFVLALTYEQLIHARGTTYPLQLRSTPIGVSNVRIEPREIDFLLEENNEE